MPLRSRTVLIVDDDVLVRSSLELVLRRAGYDVVLAEDGCRALGEISVRPIHIVLLDVSMPEACGFDTLVAMKARRPEIPVVMISGALEAAGGGHQAKAAKLGADAALAKPVRATELLALLEKLLPAAPKG